MSPMCDCQRFALHDQSRVGIMLADPKRPVVVPFAPRRGSPGLLLARYGVVWNFEMPSRARDEMPTAWRRMHLARVVAITPYPWQSRTSLA